MAGMDGVVGGTSGDLSPPGSPQQETKRRSSVGATSDGGYLRSNFRSNNRRASVGATFLPPNSPGAATSKDPLAVARQRKAAAAAAAESETESKTTQLIGEDGVPTWKKKLLEKKKNEAKAEEGGGPIDPNLPAWKRALLEKKRKTKDLERKQSFRSAKTLFKNKEQKQRQQGGAGPLTPTRTSPSAAPMSPTGKSPASLSAQQHSRAEEIKQNPQAIAAPELADSASSLNQDQEDGDISENITPDQVPEGARDSGDDNVVMPAGDVDTEEDEKDEENEVVIEVTDDDDDDEDELQQVENEEVGFEAQPAETSDDVEEGDNVNGLSDPEPAPTENLPQPDVVEQLLNEEEDDEEEVSVEGAQGQIPADGEVELVDHELSATLELVEVDDDEEEQEHKEIEIDEENEVGEEVAGDAAEEAASIEESVSVEDDQAAVEVAVEDEEVDVDDEMEYDEETVDDSEQADEENSEGESSEELSIGQFVDQFGTNDPVDEDAQSESSGDDFDASVEVFRVSELDGNKPRVDVDTMESLFQVSVIDSEEDLDICRITSGEGSNVFAGAGAGSGDTGRVTPVDNVRATPDQPVAFKETISPPPPPLAQPTPRSPRAHQSAGFARSPTSSPRPKLSRTLTPPVNVLQADVATKPVRISSPSNRRRQVAANLPPSPSLHAKHAVGSQMKQPAMRRRSIGTMDEGVRHGPPKEQMRRRSLVDSRPLSPSKAAGSVRRTSHKALVEAATVGAPEQAKKKAPAPAKRASVKAAAGSAERRPAAGTKLPTTKKAVKGASVSGQTKVVSKANLSSPKRVVSKRPAVGAPKQATTKVAPGSRTTKTVKSAAPGTKKSAIADGTKRMAVVKPKAGGVAANNPVSASPTATRKVLTTKGKASPAATDAKRTVSGTKAAVKRPASPKKSVPVSPVKAGPSGTRSPSPPSSPKRSASPKKKTPPPPPPPPPGTSRPEAARGSPTPKKKHMESQQPPPSPTGGKRRLGLGKLFSVKS